MRPLVHESSNFVLNCYPKTLSITTIRIGIVRVKGMYADHIALQERDKGSVRLFKGMANCGENKKFGKDFQLENERDIETKIVAIKRERERVRVCLCVMLGVGESKQTTGNRTFLQQRRKFCGVYLLPLLLPPRPSNS